MQKSELKKKILFISKDHLDFAIAFFILSLSYRVLFAFQVYQKKILNPSSYASVEILIGFSEDILVGICLTLFVILIRKLINGNKKRISNVICRIFEVFVLTFLAIIYVSHKNIFNHLVIGINYTILCDFFLHLKAPSVFMPYVDIKDYILIFLPLSLYFQRISFFYHTKVVIYLLIPLVLGLIFFSLEEKKHPHTFFKTDCSNTMKANPLFQLVFDSWQRFNNVYVQRKDLPGNKQLKSIRLIDDQFVMSTEQDSLVTLQAHKKQQMNVVIVVLESVGSNFIFNTTYGNRTPMPFLKWLTEKGVWLENNYTSGNISALGGFSILTGLYNSPGSNHFEMRSDLKIPTISSWLGSEYDSLLTMPASSDHFFPKSIIINSYKKLTDFNGMGEDKHKILLDSYVPEPDGFNYFLSEFDKLKPPFVATYWSGAAHIPYFDYGPAFRILSPPQQTNYSRYINNLALLDDEIKKLYEFLKNKKWLDNTLLIIVGDHGQAFGEHPGVFMHGTALYEEQIKVPVVFYQPKIFKPQIVHQVTSSVDILPTILDALEIKYDPDVVQGQSLIKSTNSPRKYIFIYGDENELASIEEKTNSKMIIDYSKGICKKFNLTVDPKETTVLSCLKDEQEKALISFKNYQTKILEKYNSSLNYS